MAQERTAFPARKMPEGIAILQKRTHRTGKRKLLAGQQAVHFLLDCIEVEFCKKFVLRCCCLIRFGIPRFFLLLSFLFSDRRTLRLLICSYGVQT